MYRCIQRLNRTDTSNLQCFMPSTNMLTSSGGSGIPMFIRITKMCTWRTTKVQSLFWVFTLTMEICESIVYILDVYILPCCTRI